MEVRERKTVRPIKSPRPSPGASAKADCEKTKDMKWDDAKKACVKK